MKMKERCYSLDSTRQILSSPSAYICYILASRCQVKEKIDDAKAVKMSVHPEEAKAKTKKMFDGKAGKKHSMSIHHEKTKATKGVLVHGIIFSTQELVC